ncbi:MAG: HAMP domain-containing histidine kinase [Prevotellaceae bacterium]|jgi:signal transduction histidine kinase|nr:HAMP domain-containing histidine kinase [Prevotellaceae bacterium]
MRLTHKSQLFLYTALIIALCTVGMSVFERYSGLFFITALLCIYFIYKSFGQSIRRLNEEEERKIRQLKQDMTGNIAHELRTPVTSIRGYLETVLEQPLDETQKEYFIRQAYNQTLVLSDLMQDMSLLTRMEEAAQSFKTEDILLGSLLTSVREDLSIALEEKDIDMQWNIPLGCVICGNRNLLYAVFRNLTDNTIRYAGEHIQIRIHLYTEDDEYYHLSYYDTGVGIPAGTHLERLFERFYRISEGRTRDSGGTGLGLSIVKNAIALHQGSITVRNRVGGGLEFLIRLKK